MVTPSGWRLAERRPQTGVPPLAVSSPRQVRALRGHRQLGDRARRRIRRIPPRAERSRRYGDTPALV